MSQTPMEKVAAIPELMEMIFSHDSISDLLCSFQRISKAAQRLIMEDSLPLRQRLWLVPAPRASPSGQRDGPNNFVLEHWENFGLYFQIRGNSLEANIEGEDQPENIDCLHAAHEIGKDSWQHMRVWRANYTDAEVKVFLWHPTEVLGRWYQVVIKDPHLRFGELMEKITEAADRGGLSRQFRLAY